MRTIETKVYTFDECIDEVLQANEYEFTADGKRFVAE